MMLSLALSMAVLASSGGLLSEHLPAGVRLLDATDAVAGALLGARGRDRNDGISPAQLQAMSLQQLKEEYDRLEDEKPGLGLGIGLLAGGVAGIVTGIVIMAAGYYVWVVTVGLVIFLAGIALAIVGPILIGSAARGRRRISRDQDAIDRQIRILESGSAPMLPTGPTPPPPPPPPLGGIPKVDPQMLVATF